MSTLNKPAALVVGVLLGALIAPATAQAVTTAFSQTKIVTSSTSTVKCPKGFKAVGGGFTIPDDHYYGLSQWGYQLKGTSLTSTAFHASVTRINVYSTGDVATPDAQEIPTWVSCLK